jgi:transposase-like protein
MSYDKKFREAVLRYIDNGSSFKEVERLFGLSYNTVSQWKRLRDETGKLENRPLNRQWKLIDPEKLRADVEERPRDSDLVRARRFGCSESGIRNALERYGLTAIRVKRVSRAPRAVRK